MTAASIIGLLTAFFTGLASIYGIYRMTVYLTKQSPEQKKEEIDQAVAREQKNTETTGRP